MCSVHALGCSHLNDLKFEQQQVSLLYSPNIVPDVKALHHQQLACMQVLMLYYDAAIHAGFAICKHTAWLIVLPA